jgi:hypothetical protein
LDARIVVDGPNVLVEFVQKQLNSKSGFAMDAEVSSEQAFTAAADGCVKNGHSI